MEAGDYNYVRDGIQRRSSGIKNTYWPRPDQSQPVLARRLWHLIDIYNQLMPAKLGKVLDTMKPDVVIVHNLAGCVDCGTFCHPCT